MRLSSAIFILAIFILSSCSAATKFSLRNISSKSILVSANGKEVEIKPGQVKTFRSLEYEGLALIMGTGTKVIYTESFQRFRSNWTEYVGKYICSGPKVSIQFDGTLSALPCNHQSLETLIIKADVS